MSFIGGGVIESLPNKLINNIISKHDCINKQNGHDEVLQNG